MSLGVLFARPAHAAEEPPLGWLFRGDLGLQQGSQSWDVSAFGGSAWSASTVSLGGRLDLNLGYAPSRLLRWGGALGVDFGSAYVERAGIPSTQVAGWQRWSVGPRLGFRFGPHAPLELELGLSYAQMRQLGSMAFIENSIEPGGYRIDDILHGAVGSVLLLYRPGGPGSLVALHGGFTGGWGYEQIQFVDDTRTHVVGLTSSFVVGLSVGN